MTGLVATATATATVAAGPDRVWAALTDPVEVAAWMAGSKVSTSWEVGSPITWAGEHDGHAYTDRGEVLVHDEPQVLSMTHYSPLMGDDDVPESHHTLVYTLTPDGDGTQLALTQDGCVDEEQAEQFGKSWQQLLDGLKAHVEG